MVTMYAGEGQGGSWKGAFACITLAMLRVDGLTKVYDGARGPAVDGVSFEIAAGELVGFIGPNGAGKTTTMRLIGGVLAPSAGRVEIHGHDVAVAREAALGSLGYLAEQPALFEGLSGRDYLRFMAEAQGCADVGKAIDTAVAMTRAGDVLDRPMATLSKGQRQRVFVAGAILHTPPLLVLDEPTDGLDPNQKHELRLVLKELAKRGTAILLSTHILEEAGAVCSRVLIVHEGKVKMDCTPAELARQGKGDMQLAFRVLTQNKGQAHA